MLLEALRLKPTTRQELAKALNVTVRPIHRHLQGLMAIGAVIRATKIRNAYIYVLTETGRKLLEVT